MGIKGLHKFLETYAPNGIKEINVSTLQDKVVAIDASIFIYQFASAIKSSVDDLKTSDGKVTTHIHGILTKTLGILKKKIKPIFVFDGKPPSLKQGVLDTRKDTKSNASLEIKQVKRKLRKLQSKLEPMPETVEDIQAQLENIAKAKELETVLTKLQKKTVSVTFIQMEECKEIIRLLGIPIIEALEEADSECAALVKSGIADCVASEDMDILTFGAPKLIRKLSSKSTVVEYDLAKILSELGLNQNQFIDLCILLGCDYTGTIGKVGPKKAYELIKIYGSIESMLVLDSGFNPTNPKYIIPENFIYTESAEYFINPPIKPIDSDKIKWTKPDYSVLQELLKTKYEYSDENIQKMFGVLQGGYYSVISGEKTIKEYNKSKSEYIKKLRDSINFDSDSD
jgi:flap endonuclease-1